MKKTDIRQVLARNLQAAMERRKVNQQQLAALTGISQSHLSEIRRGISSVTADLLADLAFKLGVEPWELLADSHVTRFNALSKLLGNDMNETDVPYAPLPANVEPMRARKEAAHKRRKKARAPDSGASR